MDTDISFFLHCFAGLLAVMDPLGVIPIYLSMTPGQTRDELRRNVTIATLTAAITLFLFAFTGNSILQFFGISLAAFKASGGILILLMAISMMEGQPRKAKASAADRAEAIEKDFIAIVPLGIPLLAGPGAISTVVLLSERAVSFRGELFLVLGILGAILVTWICLRASEYIRRALGETGIRVATRVMGLIVAALAVQFIADGLLDLFPGLKG